MVVPRTISLGHGWVGEWERNLAWSLGLEHMLMILCLAETSRKLRPTLRAGSWLAAQRKPLVLPMPWARTAFVPEQSFLCVVTVLITAFGWQVTHQRAIIDLITGAMLDRSSWASASLWVQAQQGPLPCTRQVDSRASQLWSICPGMSAPHQTGLQSLRGEAAVNPTMGFGNITSPEVFKLQSSQLLCQSEWLPPLCHWESEAQRDWSWVV